MKEKHITVNPSIQSREILVRSLRKQELLNCQHTGLKLGAVTLVTANMIELEINRRITLCPNWRFQA